MRILCINSISTVFKNYNYLLIKISPYILIIIGMSSPSILAKSGFIKNFKKYKMRYNCQEILYIIGDTILQSANYKSQFCEFLKVKKAVFSG